MKRILLLLIAPFIISQTICAQDAKTDIKDLVGLFDYDSKQPLDIKESSANERDGVKFYDINYESPKGGRVTAYLVAPSGKGPHAGIVFGHWGPGNRTEFLPEAKLYAEAGAVSIMIDYPWVRPAPWRRNQAPGVSDPQKDFDLFVQSVIDLRRAIDILLSRSDVDPKRIAYVGHSYGAQWGAILTAVDKRIKTAVLMGGVGQLTDLLLNDEDPDAVAFRNSQPKEQFDKYIELHSRIDGIRYVAHAAPVPVLFQFARFERGFNEQSMTRYAQAASEPKVIKWYDTGHDLNDVQTLIDRAEWLQKHIAIGSIKPILQKKFSEKR